MDKSQVKPGTLLLSEQPFVYILSSKFRTEHCDFCFVKKDLQRCSSCQYVYYCGKACQREGWSLHKLECANLKKVAPRIVPDAGRLLSLLIKKLGKDGNNIKSYYTKTKYRKFKDLMSHYPNIKEDPVRMEHFTSLYGVLGEFLGNEFIPNPVELLGIYGRMCVNSFNICDEELKGLGTGIYLAASIIDHSCQPNAVATFQGTLLNIRATEQMPHLNGTNYTDTLQKSEVRRKDLMSTYYFLCKCPRCLDPEETKIMSAGVCPNTKCNAALQLSAEEMGIVINVIDLDVCKVCLRKHEGVLHHLNIQHVRILDSAFESSIDFRQWDDARKFGVALIPGFKKYLGNVHPLLGLLYLKLAKILSFQGDVNEAKKNLKESCNILKITHGESSNLYKNEIIPLIQECMM
ncbi:hypothetical protein FQR65_LT03357 [Abscondita terminalis]|nr:hypothetical protein FQR65_LT03357 [Abscondita terminalis]